MCVIFLIIIFSLDCAIFSSSQFFFHRLIFLVSLFLHLSSLFFLFPVLPSPPLQPPPRHRCLCLICTASRVALSSVGVRIGSRVDVALRLLVCVSPSSRSFQPRSAAVADRRQTRRKSFRLLWDILWPICCGAFKNGLRGFISFPLVLVIWVRKPFKTYLVNTWVHVDHFPLIRIIMRETVWKYICFNRDQSITIKF